MLWIKSFHIIAIICWFVGIFYLPRLFVYHAMATDSATRNHLKVMERKLYRFISPFAVLSVVFGLWLTSYNWDYYWHSSWFVIKLSFVALLIIYHLTCGHFVNQLQQDRCNFNHIFFRWFNEAPVLALFAIVILVVVKPFT
ncbi:MAG: CopD family protein [Spongiibacteraceae bacterium]